MPNNSRRARVELRAASQVILMPHLGVQPVMVQPFEIPQGCIGLLLGRGSLTRMGLIVHPGVVDDRSSEVQVLCSCPSGVFSINPGDRIAQLIFLPRGVNSSEECGPMGSTGTDSAFLMMDLKQRPSLMLTIQGKQFEGILDTGADKSIISASWWPKSWPLVPSTHSLQGLGYASRPSMSAQALRWQDKEGKSGLITPYVLPLPVNLWGRDLMQDLGIKLSNEYSPQSLDMMERMGYMPGRGLGKDLSGRVEPISHISNKARQGLGFS